MGTRKRVLDACCGSRMFWFNRKNPDVDFVDNRTLEDTLCDGRHLSVSPDILADFRHLPFEDNSYYLVVFDPPHLVGAGENSWMAKKYGTLPKEGWQEIIHDGFWECMRVLKPNGTLIFKWNETDIPTKKIIEVIGQEPLFGHISGKAAKTQWMCFLKPGEEDTNENTAEKHSERRRSA